MFSRIAKEESREQFYGASQMAEGVRRRLLLFSTDRQTSGIPDVRNIPVQPYTGTLQRSSDGAFKALFGHSQFGGDDYIP